MLAGRWPLTKEGSLPGRSSAWALIAALGFAAAVTIAERIRPGASALLAPLVGFAVLYHLRLARSVARIADRLAGGAALPAGSPERLEAAAALVEARLGQTDERLGHTHGVTGLPTREPLIERMQQDGAGTLGIFVFTDFDRLCAFDPLLAERAIRQFAARILRMVGARHLLAQVDRCHFALWAGPEVPCAEAEAQLGAITYALGEAMPEENGGLVPETRVRHASFAGEPDTPEGLIARLLAACAVTQTLPAAAVRVDDALVEKERDRYAMEQELRSALANGEFELHYQPQVDCAAGRIAGAEALLRWNNPNRGMVSPGIFVPLLESAGLIEEVGLWALNAAIRDFSLWRAPSFASLTVAVNVSSHQLAEAGFHQRIHRMLESHGLAPRRLEIELTESAAAADVTRAARLFEAIRASGVRIAIDDFGTGFSSLSALRTLHFDKIKIDREFVTHVDTRRDSQAICQSIVALARGLGIRVLAEGVERREEYLWLRQHGCNEFQGFYFAQPLDRAAFRHFTADRRRIADLTDTTPRKLQHSIVKRLAP